MSYFFSEDILKSFISNGKLTAEDVAIMEVQMMKDQIAKIHHHKIYYTDGRWATHVDDEAYKKGLKKISACTEERLYEKLAEHYLNSITFDKLLIDWMNYSRNETARKEKTIQEDKYTYNRYLLGKDISKKDIRNLQVTDFIRFFDNLFRDNPTKKEIDKVKSLIGQLYGQAVMNKIPISNPLVQMKTYFQNKEYRQVDETPGYSQEERNILLQHLNNISKPDIYDYAIIIMFYFTIRIGELKALKWSDINNGSIYVYKQIDSIHQECDVKKKSRKGHRYLPIPESAQNILNKIPHDGDYILMKDGKTLLTDTFNRRLKKRCLECGIRYLSSHKIRFSNCTMLLDNKVDIRDVQYAMGHTEQRMTEHYYRPTYDKPANIFISQIFEQRGELRATTEN